MTDKRALSHDDAFAVLDAVALDALEAPERDAILAHAEHCTICRQELTSLRETAAFIAFAAPPAPRSVAEDDTRDRVRSRLMARAGTDRRVSALAWRRGEWLAAAAGILLVVSVAVLASVIRDRENLEGALQAEVARGEHARVAADSLRVAVMTRDSLIAGLTGRDVAMMTLTASGAKAPVAHMFWDKARNTWVLVAHNMPDPKPGRTYQLWLVTPTQKISAGTFEPRNGDAMMRATYALPSDQLKMLAVTDEPAGGMPQPTGPMVLIGH